MFRCTIHLWVYHAPNTTLRVVGTFFIAVRALNQEPEADVSDLNESSGRYIV